jgi:hypothetical protein
LQLCLSISLIEEPQTFFLKYFSETNENTV